MSDKIDQEEKEELKDIDLKVLEFDIKKFEDEPLKMWNLEPEKVQKEMEQ